MADEEGAQFVLKGMLLVVFGLAANVGGYRIQDGLADGERGIALLPGKAAALEQSFLVDPFR